MEPFESPHVSFAGSGGCQIQSFRTFLVGEILDMPQQQDFSIGGIHTADQGMNSLLSFLTYNL
jgi:hypothetical protein